MLEIQDYDLEVIIYDAIYRLRPLLIKSETIQHIADWKSSGHFAVRKFRCISFDDYIWIKLYWDCS